MRARNSTNECLPAMVFLRIEFNEMGVVKIVRNGDHAVVKSFVAGFIATD
jgi:hypothetical protein